MPLTWNTTRRWRQISVAAGKLANLNQNRTMNFATRSVMSHCYAVMFAGFLMSFHCCNSVSCDILASGPYTRSAIGYDRQVFLGPILFAPAHLTQGDDACHDCQHRDINFHWSYASFPWLPWLPMMILHRDAFTRTETFTHRRFYTQTLLHTDGFTRKHFYTHFYTDAFTHRSFYTQTLLHTGRPMFFYTHRRLYTQTLLHTGAFTHRRFYTDAFTETLLHTDTFTHRHFYTQTLFTHRCLHFTPQFYLSFWRSNLISCERVAPDAVSLALPLPPPSREK